MSTPAFCLYLWRSVNVPGLIYLAETFHRAQTLSAVLSEDGYIVKVVQLGTNEEYEIRDGVLTPRCRVRDAGDVEREIRETAQ